MSSIVAEQELYRACQIIFGLEASISREFLEYLQPSGIKSAYRKKALETHPDMVINCNELTRRKSVDLFRAVQQAYENLNTYIVAREKGFRFSVRVNSDSCVNGFRKKSGRRPVGRSMKGDRTKPALVLTANKRLQAAIAPPVGMGRDQKTLVSRRISIAVQFLRAGCCLVVFFTTQE